MRIVLVIFLAALFLSGAVDAAKKFKADFQMTGSALNGGVMEGKILYDWDAHSMAFKFNSHSYIELYRFNEVHGLNANFSKQVVFQSAVGGPCGDTCQVSAVNAAMPPLGFAPTAAEGFKSTTKTIEVGGKQCQGYENAKTSDNKNHPVEVYVAADGTPCRLVYRNARILTFTGVVSDAEVFDWTEPQECVCQRQLDIVMVVDGSGSISAAEWKLSNQWIRDAIPKFNFEKGLTALAIVQYSGINEIMLPYTTDIAKLNAYMSTDMAKHKSGTRVVPALELVRKDVYPQRRTGAVPIIITITDGADASKPDIIQAEIDNHVGLNVHNFISVYIGPDYNRTKAQMLALSNKDETRSFDYSDYSAFVLAIEDIVKAACEARIQDQDCGAGCCGFCMCSTCVSPLRCDDGNLCTADELQPTTTPNLSCCAKPKPKECVAPDKCHSSSCSTATGQCVVADISNDCPAGHACQTKGCDPLFGCQLKCGASCTPDVCDSSSCDDGNACTLDEAIKDTNGTTVECRYSPIPCTAPDQCHTAKCLPEKGCDIVPIDPAVCDDFDVCTDDFCDPQQGCVHNAKNATEYCDDGQGCTIDLCDAIRGCYTEYVECPDRPKCDIGVCKEGVCSFVKPGLCTDEIVGLGLGTAAIVAIVVGIVVALCLGGFAAYKGIEAYNAHKDLDSAGVVNPLYEQGAIEGNSAIYGRKTYEQY